MIPLPQPLPRRSRRGSAIVMMLLTLALIIGVGALVVDVGMMMLEAHTLQRASDAAALAALSRQERRVLEVVARGRTNKEIGVELGLSEKTVKNYLANLMGKLGVSRRAEAVAVFMRAQPRDFSIDA